MIIVSDTSAISALITIDQLEILSGLFGEVIIPVSVHTELLRSHSDLPRWIRVAKVTNLESALEFGKIVDPGEAEAIELAKELHADRLLIDDRKGRTLAEREGLRVIGLLGVVILAKTRGLIPSARAILERLKKEAKFGLADEILTAALASVGE